MTDRTIVDTWERWVRYHRVTIDTMDRHLQERFGHTLDEYDVLHQIGSHDEPIRMGDLAANLLVANSSCNRIVARLVEGGFVDRRRDEFDGRVVLAALTRSGESLRRRMAAAHTHDIEALFGAPLTPGRVGDLDTVLHLLLGESHTTTQMTNQMTTQMETTTESPAGR